MKPLKILATNHTSFTVSDVDRTAAFFRDALGFKVTDKLPRDPKLIESISGVPGGNVLIAYAHGPGHSVEIIEYLGPSDRGHVTPRPCDVGFAHVAYDVNDIDSAIEVCKPHEVLPIGPVTVIDKGPNAGNRVCYLRDPDGITIEFIEKAETSAG